MKIDEWFFDKVDESGNYPFFYRVLAAMWFLPRNCICTLRYRLFVRGICALKGCDVHYSCGGYLPDDVCEWYCKRCHVEGINHITSTRGELFYSGNRLHNFIAALRGQ
jgi:hypothetical protein